jgi:2-(1,2-epoxy-1,2-dihydrophenyl)acetyl-CoA isomerase
MNADWLLKDITGGVATITVNRPEVRNAISREIVAKLGEYLIELDADPQIRCIVLRGAGGHFISGADVSGFVQALDQSAEERSREFRERLGRVAPQIELIGHLTKPLVTVAEGAVAGAGISYALASDYVLASATARFVFAHVHIGLPLDCGLSYYLPRVVGLGRARRLAMTGATVDAQEALRIGMVSELVDANDLEAALSRITDRFLSLPRHALAGIKRQFDRTFVNDVVAQLALEAELVGECAADEEFVRRVNKFVKR